MMKKSIVKVMGAIMLVTLVLTEFIPMMGLAIGGGQLEQRPPAIVSESLTDGSGSAHCRGQRYQPGGWAAVSLYVRQDS